MDKHANELSSVAPLSEYTFVLEAWKKSACLTFRKRVLHVVTG